MAFDNFRLFLRLDDNSARFVNGLTECHGMAAEGDVIECEAMKV